MDIITRALRSLFPQSQAWALPATFSAVVSGLAQSIRRVYDFYRQTVQESLPGRADETLSEWYDMLGIPYDATLTLRQRRLIARQAWTNAGGSAIQRLESQVQIAFPDVTLGTISAYADITNMAGIGMAGDMQATSYPSWLASEPVDGSYAVHFFRVLGEVKDIVELRRLTGLLDRIAPAHLEPVYQITILTQTPTAQAGIGMAGLMQAGRE